MQNSRSAFGVSSSTFLPCSVVWFFVGAGVADAVGKEWSLRVYPVGKEIGLVLTMTTHIERDMTRECPAAHHSRGRGGLEDIYVDVTSRHVKKGMPGVQTIIRLSSAID